MAKIDMNVHEIDQILEEAAADNAAAAEAPPPEPAAEPPAAASATVTESPGSEVAPVEQHPEPESKETTARRRRKAKDDPSDTIITPAEIFQDKLLPIISELATAISQANERSAALEFKYSEVVKKLESLVEDLKVR